MRWGLGTILLIILVVLLVGAVPSWPYSRNWGYGLSGILGLLLIVLGVLSHLPSWHWPLSSPRFPSPAAARPGTAPPAAPPRVRRRLIAHQPREDPGRPACQ